MCLAQSAATVLALDTFTGDDRTGRQDTLPPFLSHLEAAGVRGKVCPLVGDVNVLGPHLRGPLGLVFVDGEHSETQVEHDTALAVRLTGPGSVIVWHDWYMASVQSAVVRTLDGRPGRRVGHRMYVWER